MDDIYIVKKTLEECIFDKPFKKITFSSPIEKSNTDIKITMQPMQNNKAQTFYQFSIYFGTKVRHENFDNKKDALEKLYYFLEQGYKQCDIIIYGENIKILMKRDRTFKIINQKTATEKKQDKNTLPATHNNSKNYILKENTPIPWLISLGIMDNSGKVTAKYYKKFRQLNKFLETIESIADKLPYEADIIDFGCGKSYLTFALYYYLNIMKEKNVFITGLDLKEDVVVECQRLADLFHFDKLKFIVGNIETYKHHKQNTDMVITLHACDTATDYALYGAIKWGAEIILSVPCCQHELFVQIKNDDMSPLLRHGILKERFSALLTDSLRASLLEIAGYKCNVIEFIDMEHTPKNIMIKATKKKNTARNKKEYDAFFRLKDMFGAEPKLYQLLKKENLI